MAVCRRVHPKAESNRFTCALMSHSENVHPNHLMQVMASSEKTDWATPQQWFDYLDLELRLHPGSMLQPRQCQVRPPLHTRRGWPGPILGGGAGVSEPALRTRIAQVVEERV